ncbi:hypothetical protein [Amphritea pacifica]|uniref:hypothetical protein n=1 Tax=Amphritea pacifica TaxID=2811233 RepID=UPI00196689AB|nr:hypothetical protein [Amphritea pacifica]MBN1005109.1 hypothetical protein [Amphritea pacifica]
MKTGRRRDKSGRERERVLARITLGFSSVGQVKVVVTMLNDVHGIRFKSPAF